jgi:altronate dehydratase small subunit
LRKEVFVINASDNVATLVSEDGTKGRRVEAEINGKSQAVELKDAIPFGHKFAISPIAKGAQVIKYGYSIGTATENIQPGQHVHIHNIESNRGRGDLVKPKEKTA